MLYELSLCSFYGGKCHCYTIIKFSDTVELCLITLTAVGLIFSLVSFGGEKIELD